MFIDNLTTEYLAGQRISNNYKLIIPSSELHGRNTLLTKLVAGKKVLHLGCADHIDLIQKKQLSGTYLHDLLVRSADFVIGTDVNVPAVTAMKEFGIKNVYSDDELPVNIAFDMVVVPDVIEHVRDVHQFLTGLRKYNCPIVITTPNSYRLYNRFQFRGELVNTDHKCWFSPYTLAKVISDAGYQIDAYYYTDSLSLLRPIQAILKIAYPLTRDGLLAVCHKV